MKNILSAFIVFIFFLVASCMAPKDVQVSTENVQLVSITTQYRINKTEDGWVKYYELHWQTVRGLTYTEFTYSPHSIGETRKILLTR